MDDRAWHSMNHLGTPYFTNWGNMELLTYNGFEFNYDFKAYSGECCAGYEYDAIQKFYIRSSALKLLY